MAYTARAVDLELDELLRSAPAVAIDGSKAVGKTETARRRAATTWFLDQPEHRESARIWLGEEDPHPSDTVLLDEWQRLPESWDLVRRAVDRGVPQVGSC